MELERLSAYLPLDRRHALAAGLPLPDRAVGAVLLADIAGFTPWTHALATALGPRLGAEELTRRLNDVYEALIAQVHRYGGSVTGFSGDGFVCWFDGDPALRAVACGLALQRAMAAFAAVPAPDGGQIELSLKAAVAAGPVRRFLVGDPQVQRIDLLAGATLERMAQAEGLAGQGELVADPEAARRLGDRLLVNEWRQGFGVVQGLEAEVPPTPWPPLPADALRPEQVRPFLLPPVYGRLVAGQGEFLAELRPAVALFLRFAGFDYDRDDDAGGRLDAYVRWVQGVLEDTGGTLLQLTTGEKGSYLYASFGALAAHEDDAARSLAAAWELRHPPAEYHVREVQIGLSQGPVRAGAYGGQARRTYGALGDEVNVAARLMQAAPPGEIRCSGRIYEAAKERWTFEALPPVQVKGMDRPLPVLRPLGPGRGRGVRAIAALVGRQAEVGVLARLLAEVQAGRRRVLLLEGEAGIGKSRLLAELERLARKGGVAWLEGVGQSVEQRTPYRAWREVLSAYFGLDALRDIPDAAAERRRRVHECVAAVDPALAERAPLLNDILRLDLPETALTAGFDPRLRHGSLTLLVVDLLRAAAGAPLVLVLEDAHWLDSLSWELALAVARALYDRPLLLVLALRPLEEPRQPEYEALVGLEGAETLRLEAMPAEETSALAAARLGVAPEALPPEVAALVRERAGGNPFFAEELAHVLRDSGAVAVEGGACTIAGDLERLRQSVPDTVEGVVLARIDRLPPEQQLTLKVAAVVGRSFLFRTLRDVHPRRVVEDLLHAHLDDLARRDLTPLEALEPELTYLFKHIITQQVAYDTLLFAQRRELHRAVAGWYERVYAADLSLYYPLLVYHWNRAEDAEQEGGYARLAGEQAAAQYANAEAVAYLGRALELAPESAASDRLALLLVREKVHGLLGDRESQRQDLEALEALAQALPAGPEQAEVALRRAFYAEVLADYEGCIAAARAAVDLARASGAVDPEIDGLLRWGVALARQGKGDEAIPQVEAALAMARRHGLPKREADSLMDLGIVAMDQGHYDRARAMYEQALEIYRSLGDRRNEGSIYNNLGVVAYYQSDYAQAVARWEQCLQLSRLIGNSVNAGLCLNNLGAVTMEAADYAQARSYLEEALALNRTIGERRGEGMVLNNLGSVAMAQGDWDRARSSLEGALRINREIGYRLGEIVDLDHLGTLFLFLGGRAQASTCFQGALRLSREMGHRRGEAAALSNLARLDLARGEGTAAAEAQWQAVEIARELGDDGLVAYALTGLGQALVSLDRLAEARAAYQEAHDLQRQMDRAHLALDPLAGLASVSLAEGDRDRAVALVDEILALLETVPLDGADDPLQIYLTCYRVLQRAGAPRAAEILSTAYDRLQAEAATIGQAQQRASFLEEVAVHRDIVAAYQAIEDAHRHP
jgi:class 3 adenylate cyclase/tetratricopeptide (TPR) repeat protein